MNRRNFIQQTSRAAMVLPFLNKGNIFQEKRMGIVVHSYANRWNSKTESKKYPGFSDAIGLIEHCYEIGAGGVQVGVGNWTSEFAKRVKDVCAHRELYLEGSVSLPANPNESSVFEQDVKRAREAGASILRTVCLNGRRYEDFHTLKAFLEFKEKSLTSLEIAEPIVRKHKMKLAIENHKDWRADELAAVMKKLDSEWVGVTVDFGNSIALLEDPMKVVETLAPYAFSTHVKDMAVQEYPDGFLLSEVPLGEGILDLPKMIAICKQHNPGVHFSLEMITRDPLKIPCLTEAYWATFPETPGIDLAKMLQMVRQHPFASGLPEVSGLNAEERLAVEEENIIRSIAYSKTTLGLK